MFTAKQSTSIDYEKLGKQQQAKIEQTKRKISQFGQLRIVLALVEVLFFVAMLNSSSTWLIFAWVFLLFLGVLAFVWVVKKQSKWIEVLAFQQNLYAVFENEQNSLMGKPNSYDNGEQYVDETHLYSSDLDIFGKHSIYELINRCTTRLGNERLATHLKQALNKQTIMERQEAIRELATCLDETFEFRALMKGTASHAIDVLKNKLSIQLTKQVAFASHRGLQFYVKSVPILSFVLIFMAFLLGGSWNVVLGIYLLGNASLTYFFAKNIQAVYHGFGASATSLAGFASAIAWIEKIAWQSAYIQKNYDSREATSAFLKDLAKIMTAFDARLNFLLNALLNFLLLWDLRCSIKLYYWQQRASQVVASGLDNLGFFEELISFATLHANHPAWVFPKLTDEFCIETTAIGHPLIDEKKRVLNDFSFNKNPTVDIVTGSNMAGKSTFLRTLGVNLVLAYAGAPVCASQAKLSIFNLLSYMRIKDNLIENTSTFKAELNRLKMILKEIANQENCLVLIDEMLRGTNSKDKFEGSKAFIQKMLTWQVSMLFATHDLQLSELEIAHPNSVRNFHFDIQLQANEMAFDYRIKLGPCNQFNAAFLLKEIGL